MSKTWITRLKNLRVCPMAVEWAAQYETAQAAWDACGRGDWMLWYCGAVAGPPDSASRRRLLLACVECAELAYPCVREQDRAVVRRCLNTALASGTNQAGVRLDALRRASEAAHTASITPACFGNGATHAAAHAADAGLDTVAAMAASGAAGTAAIALAHAHAGCAPGDDDAKAAALQRCAELVRGHYPTPPAAEEVGQHERT